MRVGWNEKTIGWLRSASAFTGFHRQMAGLLAPEIAAGGTMCDLGCGVGLIDLELAPSLEQVTCVDTSAPALAALERMAEERGLSNLETRLTDVDKLEGAWDTVLSLFFGNGKQMARWLSRCRQCVVAVLAEGEAPSFGPGHPPKYNTAQRAERELAEAGVAFHMRRGALEYGQPFRSREEAQEFARVYGKDKLAEDLLYLRTRLTATGDPEYPWYLPQRKRFVIFTLRKEENRL